MGPHRNPEDRLLEGRELPKELLKKFNAWNISRQERDTFRDRLWATCPTSAELDTVAAAKNPWAELGRLEDRPHPPKRDQHQKLPPLASREGDEPEEDRSPIEEKPAHQPLAKAVLPKLPSMNPYTDRLREMSDEDLLEFYDNFRKLYHLDSPYAVPEAMLQDSKLLIYQALTAEVLNRKQGK